MVKKVEASVKPKKVKGAKQPVRLYSRGVVLGYQRARKNQNESISLVRLEGVNTRQDAQFYVGRRVAYIYSARKIRSGHKHRIIWGKIRAPHGNNGVVRTKFTKNLPPQSFGRRVRIFMYPSNI